jgi:uncharacterized protein YjbJ (UPF0337 family)
MSTPESEIRRESNDEPRRYDADDEPSRYAQDEPRPYMGEPPRYTQEDTPRRYTQEDTRRYRRRYDYDGQSPQEIERDIDETRADMRSTLETLEQRLSFDRLMQMTVGRVRERGGEFAGNLTEAATQNPVPMLLTSIGLGWMMLSSRHPPRDPYEDEYRRSGPGIGDRIGGARDRMRGARERMGAGADRVGAEMHGAMDSARGRMRHAADSTRDTLRHATESSRESFRHAAESLRSGAGRAREQVDYTRERMDRMLNEQPLLLGAFGIAAGAIIGALLPTTEHENRMLGETRDKALRKAAERARRYETAREDESPAREGDSAYAQSAQSGSGADTGGASAPERPSSRPH